MTTKTKKVPNKLKDSVEVKGVKGPLTLFVLMFKIIGHETWRINMFKTKDDLNKYLSNQPGHPEITEKKWFIADKINATIIPE